VCAISDVMQRQLAYQRLCGFDFVIFLHPGVKTQSLYHQGPPA
jgi:uncharacterized protein (DUF934 family)